MWAICPKRTKSRNVSLARNASDMLATTMGSVSAKSPRIPCALFDLAAGINVKVEALRIAALPIHFEEPALWHLLEVVLVQEFTTLPLLAKTPQPMLAHHRFLRPRVLKLARGTTMALSLQKILADTRTLAGRLSIQPEVKLLFDILFKIKFWVHIFHVQNVLIKCRKALPCRLLTTLNQLLQAAFWLIWILLHADERFI